MTASPSIAAPPASWLDRNFSRLLLAIALTGLVPCIFVGKSQFIGFDGWWHVFIATQDRWSSLLAEWKFVAHPPLFYPLLRFVALFGHAPLILRSVGIAAGCAGSYVIGLVAAKICRYKASALLTALAYTFSWSMIELNCEVRAYALALFFVLLAFNAYIDWVSDPASAGSGRTITRFGVYSMLAMMSEFYVVFFLVGCIAILFLRFLLRPAFRAMLLSSLRTNWQQWLGFGVALAASFLILFVVQIVGQPPTQYYLEKYYWDPSSPFGLDGFLLSNFGQEISYFTPLNIDPGIMLAVVALLFFPPSIYFAFRRKRRGTLSAYPPLMLAFLLAQLVLLALVRRYPFGGELRHQSIIFPFVFLTAFLLLDRLADAIPLAARCGLFLVVGLISAASFASGWTAYHWSSVEPNTAEYAIFQSMFPAPDTIYGDVTSTLFFYTPHNCARWTLQDRLIVNEERITVYQVDQGDGHPIRVLRNKRRAYFDLADPSTYQVLAATLRQQGLRSAVLFYEGLAWNTDSAKILQDKFRTLAPLAGLDYGRYSLGTTYAFIEFKLR